MRRASILIGFAGLFAFSLPAAGQQGRPRVKDSKKSKEPRPSDRPESADQSKPADREDKKSIASGRDRVARDRRSPKYVVTPEMRNPFPTGSAEKEVVVRYKKMDDGYLIYSRERTEAFRAKMAAYSKVPINKIPKTVEYSVPVRLEKGARRANLRRRKGQMVRLKLKQDRNGRFVVRDVLPAKR